MNFDEYRQYDAMGLAALVRARDVNPHDLLEIALERSDAVNDDLNIISVDDEAFARTRLDGQLRGPLAGVPFLFKDLYCFLKDTVFTNGSRLLGDFKPPANNTFVQRCLDTGLVPFGKTATPEFGINVVSASIRHGPSLNPWDRSRSPGGSSGGAGAAVAAGIVPMAHGTDGGGSIRIPASACGLFGLKPSRARMPVGPVVGEAWNGLATGHVLTRSVRDSALMLDLIGGAESGDPYACPRPSGPFLELAYQPASSLRIGLWRHSPFGTPINQSCLDAVEHTAKLLGDLGHRVEEAAPEVNGQELIDAELTIIAVNQANDLEFWANLLQRPLDLDYLETATLTLAERGRQHSGVDLARAIDSAHSLARQFGRFFEQYDLLLTPTLGTTPLEIGKCNQNSSDVKGFLDETISHIPFTPLYNMSGCPAASVPLYWDADGLPIGSMLGAALGREDLLLQVSRQCELAQPWFNKLPS